MEIKRKPIMVLGPTGSGKSTLLKALTLVEGEVKKTESIFYSPHAIDTPGEMIHIPYLYNALILNSAKASLALFVVAAKRTARLPSKIALALKVPAIGVVSQIDGAKMEDIERSERILAAAGLKKIFRVSSITGEGLPALRCYLNNAASESPGSVF
ncbi:MAG: EutP/PduV family microcompartment system protein [Treponema sp.]|jgi:ethanolamine utilization protein EutP|nr:EutP/PduV family microcompartment system protein [Treponema sp.]